MFDPMQDVPRTDEEAIIALRYGKDGLVGDSLVGIFQIRRLQGADMLSAYEYALLVHVGELPAKE